VRSGTLRHDLPVVRRVAIGADHGGFALKAALIPRLRAEGYEVADLGTHSPAPCDYPAIGYKVARAVAEGRFDRGVLLCKSGIGIAVVANKLPGIRAAVCADAFDARRSRAHNDANVLVLGAEKLNRGQAARILEVWCATPFEAGGRHERRVRQIAAIEQDILRGAPRRPARRRSGRQRR
jgi:ribose 5-phosphate isomerase B